MSAVAIYQQTGMPARVDSWVKVVADVAQLAQTIATTDFVPQALRGNVPAITATILYGREIGLPPMQALRSIHLIQGRPSLSAESMRGLALAAGHEIEYAQADGGTCTVRGRRAGRDSWHTVTWTIDNATRLGLTRNPTWKSYPRAMLKARATSELCRDLFADVVGGFAAVEDSDVLMDAVEAPITAVETSPPPTRTVSRARRSAPRTTPQAQRSAPIDDGPGGPAVAPAPPPGPSRDTSADDHHLRESDQWSEPPLPIQDPHAEYEDDGAALPASRADAGSTPAVGLVPPDHETEVAEHHSGAAPSPDPEPDPAPDPSRGSSDDVETGEAASREQGRLAFALLGDLGYREAPRPERLRIGSALVGREVGSFNELTRREASTLIDTLQILAAASDGHEQLAAIVDRATP